MRGITALTECAANADAAARRRDPGLVRTASARRVGRFTGRRPLDLVSNVRDLDYGRLDLPASMRYVGNLADGAVKLIRTTGLPFHENVLSGGGR